MPKKNSVKNYCCIPLTCSWFDIRIPETPVIAPLTESSSVDRLTEFETLKLKANDLLDQEIKNYEKSKSKDSDAKFTQTVLKTGTHGDRLSALTLLVQESPVHNLSALKQLIEMTGSKSRREFFSAADLLRELFCDNLLPDERKLISFERRNVERVKMFDQFTQNLMLILWYFESELKTLYSQYLENVKRISLDPISGARTRSIKLMFNLMVSKPEAEDVLLSLIVNKLGDPDSTVVTTCIRFLNNLLRDHPVMKEIVAMEIERLIFRPNLKEKAQFQAVCFLTNMRLHKDYDAALAQKLISIYLTIFKLIVKRNDSSSRLLSTLLFGISKAYSITKGHDAKPVFQDELNTLFKIVYSSNFNVAVQALSLLILVSSDGDLNTDRFYVALYRKLLDPDLKSSSKQPLFLGILLKALKNDCVKNRILAFLKRLLQCCKQSNPCFVTGALLVVAEVLKDKPGLLIKQNIDGNVSPAKIESQQTNVDLATDFDDDEEEHFIDAPNEDSDIDQLVFEDRLGQESDNDKAFMPRKHTSRQSGSKQSWVHKYSHVHNATSSVYDPFHRNPKYCSAESELLWEIQALTTHYHPTVSLYAKSILNNQSIEYDGDPLADFALIRFLDRFIYKNPKKKPVKTTKRRTANINAPVNSDIFQSKNESDIPVDQRFFHKFFTQFAGLKPSKDTVTDADSDAESVQDEEFDNYLDSFESGLVGKTNFSAEFDGKSAKKKSKKRPDSDDEPSEDDEFEDDEEPGFDLADFKGQFDESDDDEDDAMENDNSTGDTPFNEEDIAFDDEENMDFDFTRSKRQLTASRRRKIKTKSSESAFASAEEFSHLLEDNPGRFSGGSEAMNVSEGVNQKQLEWEMRHDKPKPKKGKWNKDRKSRLSTKQSKRFKTKNKPRPKSTNKGRWNMSKKRRR